MGACATAHGNPLNSRQAWGKSRNNFTNWSEKRKKLIAVLKADTEMWNNYHSSCCCSFRSGFNILFLCFQLAGSNQTNSQGDWQLPGDGIWPSAALGLPLVSQNRFWFGMKSPLLFPLFLLSIIHPPWPSAFQDISDWLKKHLIFPPVYHQKEGLWTVSFRQACTAFTLIWLNLFTQCNPQWPDNRGRVTLPLGLNA